MLNQLVHFFRRVALLSFVVSLLVFTFSVSAQDATPELSGHLNVTIWGTPQDTASIQASIDQFTTKNPGVKIDVQVGDCGVSYAACATLIAGGAMPDVFVSGIWNYNRYVADGLATNLDPYIAKDDVVKAENFNSMVWNDLQALSDKSHYGLPMGLNVQSLYFNKTMFDKAGLAYPSADGKYTWDDVREWSKKLTLDKNGNNATSSDFDPKNIVQWGAYLRNTEPILNAFGGSTMTLPDRQSCNLENPKTVEAYQWIQDFMYKDHTALTPSDTQEQEGYLRWINGQVAMQMGSHEQTTIAADINPDLKYDIAPLPQEQTFVQYHIWTIYSGSPSQDLAWSFIKYMATDGSVGPKGSLMGLIPAYKDLAQGPAFAKAKGEPEHIVQGQLDPLKWDTTSYPSFFNQNTDAIGGQDGYGPAISDIMTNAKPAAEALAGVCAKVDTIMKGQ
ncbi:MAG: sugar ABC transporter substrate-binding protein [Chloroflexota bacterium]